MNFPFNTARAKVKYYAELPAANDGLVLVMLKASGLEADDVLRDYTTLAAILAASNDEATFTNYARIALTSGDLTLTVSNTLNRFTLSIANKSIASAGGATNNSLGKLLCCYDPDTTGGTDADLVPMLAWDFVVTTDGTTLPITFAASGAYRAA